LVPSARCHRVTHRLVFAPTPNFRAAFRAAFLRCASQLPCRENGRMPNS
jgi:hypothetical protein